MPLADGTAAAAACAVPKDYSRCCDGGHGQAMPGDACSGSDNNGDAFSGAGLGRPRWLGAFVRSLPKAELHVHVEGTLEPEMMFEMAQRNGVELPYPTAQAARQAYRFRDLSSFLALYHCGITVLQEARDFYDLAWAYFQRAARAGVVHVEMFFDPQAHLVRGIPYDTFLGGIRRAAQDAERQLGVSCCLLACYDRTLPEEDALQAFDAGMHWRREVAGIGLDCAERGNPPSKFERLYQRARKEGMHRVCHAGEEGPPEFIWEALRLLRVQRIDHGTHCVRDASLMTQLAERRVPLTFCPTSNLALKVFDTAPAMAACLHEMLQAKLVVTLNSDDPAYFFAYVYEVYEMVAEVAQLSPTTIALLARNSIEASFMAPAAKQRWSARVDDVLAQLQRQQLQQQHLAQAQPEVRMLLLLMQGKQRQGLGAGLPAAAASAATCATPGAPLPPPSSSSSFSPSPRGALGCGSALGGNARPRLLPRMQPAPKLPPPPARLPSPLLQRLLAAADGHDTDSDAGSDIGVRYSGGGAPGSAWSGGGAGGPQGGARSRLSAELSATSTAGAASAGVSHDAVTAPLGATVAAVAAAVEASAADLPGKHKAVAAAALVCGKHKSKAAAEAAAPVGRCSYDTIVFINDNHVVLTEGGAAGGDCGGQRYHHLARGLGGPLAAVTGSTHGLGGDTGSTWSIAPWLYRAARLAQLRRALGTCAAAATVAFFLLLLPPPFLYSS